MSEYSAEFCPRCMSPVEFSVDADRLCEICGWFGDRSEVLDKPPCPERLNPILAVTQCLALYRDVCRHELIAQQMYDAGNATEADMRKIRVSRNSALNAIVEMFVNLQKLPQAQKPDKPQKRILRCVNGMLYWPDDWEDRHHNGGEQCDMLIGPCSCGAWHHKDERWVQAFLAKYNAEIAEE